MASSFRRVAIGVSGVLVALLAARPTPAGPAGPAKAWFLAKPPPATQTMKPASERGDNPCDTQDPGFGAYERWTKLSGSGQALVPKRIALTPSGEFDLVIHFHGHEPARKEWVRVMKREVFVGITLGVRSGPYEAAFAPPEALSTLVQEVERVVSEKAGKPGAHARRIALSAWSAGYGAVKSVLRTPYGRKRVDGVLLLDGLHCDYAGEGLEESQLEPFLGFAKRAAAGERLMVVTHSSIIPPGYASTTEASNYLVHSFGSRPRAARPRSSDPYGLELLARFDRQDFHVLGFSGNGTLDHCAHVGLLRDILKVHLAPRWKRAP
jgi:hypothetical protein